MKVSSFITMINSASLTPWLIQVKNFLTMQELLKPKSDKVRQTDCRAEI